MNGSFAKLEHIFPLFYNLSLTFLVAIFFTLAIFVRYFLPTNESEIFLKIFKEYKKSEIIFLILLIILSISNYFWALFDSKILIKDPMIEAIIATKWVLIVYIFVNFSYMHYKFLQSKICFKNSDFIGSFENLTIISYFSFLNIVVCGLILYLDVALSDLKW